LVQVVGDDGRGDVEQPAQVRDGLGERHERLVVLQVTEVVGDERVPGLGHAHGALQLRAAGQDMPWERPGEREGVRDVAAGAADGDRPARDHPGDRVVHAHVDRAVVGQERVSDASQARERVLVAVGDRLVGGVPAGQHERRAVLAGEDVVQPGGGQHEPQPPVAGGHGGGDPRAAAAAQQHDRGGAAGQQVGLPAAHLAQRRRGLQIAHEDRERLVLPMLARTQCGGRPLVGGVDGEVVAAQALDGDHSPPAQQP
jgi:hypothetical protein